MRALGVSPALLALSAPRYDLVVQGGRVIDPSRSVSERLDIGIAGGVITRLARSIPENDARQILDAREKIVTPGLIDVHVHVYDGVAGVGIWPDKACLARGSTTVLDGGSAGATTLAGFRSYVVERAETRVGVLLNLSTLGLTSMRELSSLAYADVERAARAIEENRDIVFGIKVRMTRDIEGGKDLEALRLARQLAEDASVPLMVHIGVANSPVGRFLDELRSGDVVTHSFRARGSILDVSGRVLPEALEARQRGIHFDIGHGAGTFLSIPRSALSSRTFSPTPSRAISIPETSPGRSSIWRRRFPSSCILVCRSSRRSLALRRRRRRFSLSPNLSVRSAREPRPTSRSSSSPRVASSSRILEARHAPPRASWFP